MMMMMMMMNDDADGDCFVVAVFFNALYY